MKPADLPPRGVFEWLWQSRDMKRYRANERAMSPEHKALLDAARTELTKADRLANEPPWNARPELPSSALELYGSSALKSLAVLTRRVKDEAAPDDLQDTSALLRGSRLALGEHLQHPERMDEVCELITALQVERSPMPPCDPDLAADWARTSRRLFEVANEASMGIVRIWLDRLRRVVIPVLLCGLGLVLGTGIHDWLRLSEETTFPWRASSTHHEPACRSPRQGCEQDHFFFHTRLEKEPWIVFDISKFTTVSKVTITNRTDCSECSKRAVPLLLELADDDRKFRVVARKDEDFVIWSPSFPRQKARYVRLRSPERTYLHFKQVRIQR